MSYLDSYLHWPASASELEVWEEVEMGWRGEQRSGEEC